MFRRVFLSVGILALVSCSSTFNVYKENFRLLFDNPEAPVIDKNYLSARKFDVIRVELGKVNGVMALAFAEHDQEKFISADGAFLIFSHGRIVRTSGFSNDLLFTSNLKSDPLLLPYSAQDGASWAYVSQTSRLAPQVVKSNFKLVGETTLRVLDSELLTVLIEENISVADSDKRTNLYWYEASTGELVQVSQHTPNTSTQIKATFLSRINRLLNKNAGVV